MTYMSAADQDDAPVRYRPHSVLSEREERELEARAIVALSELRPGRCRSTEIDHRGFAVHLRTRAAALCAKALLSDELLDHVSMQMRNGRWVVAGAWRRDLLAGAR